MKKGLIFGVLLMLTILVTFTAADPPLHDASSCRKMCFDIYSKCKKEAKTQKERFECIKQRDSCLKNCPYGNRR